MTLRLLFDEQTSKESAGCLSELGPGIDDDTIRSYAVTRHRNVVTEDPDFLDGSADPGADTYPGVISCTSRSPQVIHDGIRALGRFHSTEDLSDRKEPVYVPGRWID